MQLKKLTIEGFKSIKRLDLDLRDVNVLIGPNGAGKSNFISFFRMLNDMVRENFQLFVQKVGRAESLLYYGPKTTDSIEARLDFGSNGYAFKLVPTEDNRFVFGEERLHFRGSRYSSEITQEIGRGHEESNLRKAYERDPSGIPRYVYNSVKTWQVYHFHDTGPNAPPKQACDVNDNEMLHPDAGNLAAFLYLMRERNEENYTLIRQTVQRIFPRFDDFALRPHPLNEHVIRLEWREKGSDYRFQPHQLSDGTLRFICLATLLLQPDPPATIIVDEPELGLHPRALSVLAGLVQSVAARRQVIMTTQSVTLLNQFDPEDVVVIEREDDVDNGIVGATRAGSTFRRLSDEQELATWLDDYTIGELWEMNVIGGRP
jgi:predicted ATPase